MKKFLMMCSVFLFSVSMFSCGKQNSQSGIVLNGHPDEFKTDDEMLSSGYVNGKELIDYEKFISTEEFYSFLEDFKDPVNPLDIKSDLRENASAGQPFMPVVISMEEKEVIPLNIWYVPITDGEKYIGKIDVDCRGDIVRYSATGGFADFLNEELQKGDMVVFSTGAGIYGMHEDNSVVGYASAPEYTGNMSFEELNKDYNFVRQEK